MYNSALVGYLGPSEFRVASATATTSVVVSYYFQQLSSQKIKPREVVGVVGGCGHGLGGGGGGFRRPACWDDLFLQPSRLCCCVVNNEFSQVSC